ncbi:DUF421 domain-containing protein [Sphingomonas sp. MAH-20]|uniref:DUF421 domain-containing protein n=1 Tax=Sphingomonas horti TaxID=2682842 RepID=A0A6I4J3S2_9SPHN|nr:MULTISPECIES: YetF domain-containing protein [Sphingomonas]MBA2919267.1 DUF421 domain-containing protein [Sphingomonas sp. CGMCC 1.13658]MVO79300.1 DUF421 domain-containing protein [Sphingomonas horti]
MALLPVDWHETFGLETPLLELLVRGTALYFGVLALVRIMPRRTGGELATMDLIFVLLIAEAAAHALGDYSSVADALVMIITLMAWNWCVNAMSYRFPAIERLASAPPIEVIREGKLLRRSMRREYLTEAELMSHLRKEGLEGLAKVKSACIESDGRISVIQATK